MCEMIEVTLDIEFSEDNGILLCQLSLSVRKVKSP